MKTVLLLFTSSLDIHHHTLYGSACCMIVAHVMPGGVLNVSCGESNVCDTRLVTCSWCVVRFAMSFMLKYFHVCVCFLHLPRLRQMHQFTYGSTMYAVRFLVGGIRARLQLVDDKFRIFVERC